MNKEKIARELIKIAKNLIAQEPKTKNNLGYISDYEKVIDQHEREFEDAAYELRQASRRWHNHNYKIARKFEWDLAEARVDGKDSKAQRIEEIIEKYRGEMKDFEKTIIRKIEFLELSKKTFKQKAEKALAMSDGRDIYIAYKDAMKKDDEVLKKSLKDAPSLKR